MFKGSIGGCGCRFPPSSEPGCAGLCAVFHIIVLYLNDLPSEALSSTLSISSL